MVVSTRGALTVAVVVVDKTVVPSEVTVIVEVPAATAVNIPLSKPIVPVFIFELVQSKSGCVTKATPF